MTKEFSLWLKTSKPGDIICYHKGSHVAGNSIAKIAYDAYEEGLVLLYQKREPVGFSYFAKKRTWD